MHLEDPRLEAARRRRDAARWYLVVGFALLFGAGAMANVGGIVVPILLGAVVTTAYGAVAWGFWAWRMHKLDDPWAYDPDLDGPLVRGQPSNLGPIPVRPDDEELDATEPAAPKTSN